MATAIQFDIDFNTLPTVSCGQGCHVFDASGKRYIYGPGGAALFSLGHAYPDANMLLNYNSIGMGLCLGLQRD